MAKSLGADRQGEEPPPDPIPGHDAAKRSTRRARMTDVGALAGVSHQTVSRVLNNSPRVAPETRKRVLGAIEELGYRRNTAARLLASSRSRVIGVVTYGTAQYGPSSVILGLQNAARETVYELTIVGVQEFKPESFRAAVTHLMERSVECLVLVVPHRKFLDWARQLELGIPMVVVEGDLSGAPLTAGVDQVQGARLATRHLLNLGHETVVHLAGPDDWPEALARRTGWRMELEAAGRYVPPLRWAGDWSARSGYEAGQSLAGDRSIRAVFTGNDQMALGLIHALREVGRRVPEDVSVVGFDDLPESAFFAPPLTTVRQDFAQLGRRAMGLVVRVLDGESEATVPLVDPILVVRQSTAPVGG